MVSRDLLHNLIGFTCFSFATVIAIQSVWQNLGILPMLYALHNGLLALFYLRREPARAFDRLGLWLGLIAAFLPTCNSVSRAPLYFLIPALAGYALILWSLLTIGPRFGIAPADRGITCRGPYRFLRHPMYLGELVFRLAMALSSPNLVLALLLAITLIILQCWRIMREERIISGYACYARLVPWRLIPHLW
jgi:protein-S-isoprenylcysteine O-methyltransferase Ste14